MYSGGRAAAWSMLDEHTRLEVTLPPSAGGKQLMQIWVGPNPYQMQLSSEADNCFVKYAPPKIISCTELSSPGNIMSITGQHFGNSATVAVKIGGTHFLQPLLRELHNRITCQIPETPERKRSVLSVQLCVGGQWSDSSNPDATFSYKGQSCCHWALQFDSDYLSPVC